MGSYELNGGRLRFPEMGGTLMACADMNMESAFMKALEEVAAWRISGPRLELMNDEGTIVASFEARNL
jgi:heat shock protein HslJ